MLIYNKKKKKKKENSYQKKKKKSITPIWAYIFNLNAREAAKCFTTAAIPLYVILFSNAGLHRKLAHV